MRDTIKLILLGTGGPRLTPMPPRGGPSQLIIAGEDTILIDCGPGATLNMVRAGIKPSAAHYLFFTHIHHYDHNADYIPFIFENWIWAYEDNMYQPLQVYGPQGTHAFHDRCINQAYAEEVQLRKSYGERDPRFGEKYLPPVVNITELEGGPVCSGKRWNATSTKVPHGPHALAYRFDMEDKSIVVSGDLSELATLTEFAHQADIFVIDAMHPSAEDIGKTAEAAQVKTLVLSHIIYGWFNQKLNLETKKREITAWYSGELIEARDLMTFKL
jgi:ribonuclease BN (tRNA processing enzyme)